MIAPGRILVILDRAIGVLGLFTAALNFCFYMQIMHGPGDNNPIALVFIAGFLSSPLPIWGLRSFLSRPPVFGTITAWVWRIFAFAHLWVFFGFVLLVFGLPKWR